MFRDKRRKRRKSSKIFFSQFTNEKDKENRDMFEIILMNEYCWWKILIKNCLTLSLQFQLSIKDRSKRRLLFNILDKHSHESRIYKFYDIYTIKHVYKKKQTKNRINFLQFLLIKRLFKIISRFQRVRAARLNKIRYEIKRATTHEQLMLMHNNTSNKTRQNDVFHTFMNLNFIDCTSGRNDKCDIIRNINKRREKEREREERMNFFDETRE